MPKFRRTLLPPSSCVSIRKTTAWIITMETSNLASCIVVFFYVWLLTILFIELREQRVTFLLLVTIPTVSPKHSLRLLTIQSIQKSWPWLSRHVMGFGVRFVLVCVVIMLGSFSHRAFPSLHMYMVTMLMVLLFRIFQPWKQWEEFMNSTTYLALLKIAPFRVGAFLFICVCHVPPFVTFRSVSMSVKTVLTLVNTNDPLSVFLSFFLPFFSFLDYFRNYNLWFEKIPWTSLTFPTITQVFQNVQCASLSHLSLWNFIHSTLRYIQNGGID
jgi:hypothetical protein